MKLNAFGSSSSVSTATAGAKGAKGQSSDTDGSVNDKADKQLKLGNDTSKDATGGAKDSGRATTPAAATADGGSVSVAAAVAFNLIKSSSTAKVADVNLTSTHGA